LRAFRLINKTASDVLIKKWIKKNRPYLECEKKERKEFEKYIGKVERDLKAEKQMTYPDDKDSTDRLFIHEFSQFQKSLYCEGCNTSSPLISSTLSYHAHHRIHHSH
jgi:hypothetical protein